MEATGNILLFLLLVFVSSLFDTESPVYVVSSSEAPGSFLAPAPTADESGFLDEAALPRRINAHRYFVLCSGILIALLLWLGTSCCAGGIAFDASRLLLAATLTTGHLSDSWTIVSWFDLIEGSAVSRGQALKAISSTFCVYVLILYLMRRALQFAKQRRKTFADNDDE